MIAVLAPAGLGCTEVNPAYRGGVHGGAGAMSGGGGAGGAAGAGNETGGQAGDQGGEQTGGSAAQDSQSADAIAGGTSGSGGTSGGAAGDGGAGAGGGAGGTAAGGTGAGGVDAGVEAAAPIDVAPEANPSDPLALGLRGYWSFDEGTGTTTADRIRSYGGNNGTLKSGATWGAELTGSTRMSASLSLDGTDDFADFTATSMPAIGAAKSITFWMAWAGTGMQLSNQRDVIALADPTAEVGIQLGTVDGKLGVWQWKDNAGFIELALNANSPGTWHQVAYTFDGTTHTLYLDGGTANSSGGAQKSLSNLKPQSGTATTLKMGSYDGMNPNEFFRGLIDEVRIYDRPLSAAEIKQLYDRR
jgi:hypothetical protein